MPGIGSKSSWQETQQQRNWRGRPTTENGGRKMGTTSKRGAAKRRPSSELPVLESTSKASTGRDLLALEEQEYQRRRRLLIRPGLARWLAEADAKLGSFERAYRG